MARILNIQLTAAPVGEEKPPPPVCLTTLAESRGGKMPDSIVIELQRDALDRNCRVTDLLRKAFVVAKKLNTSEFENWITKELNGYGEAETVPEYRMIRGQVRGWNPYHGWQPIYFPNAEMEDKLSQCGNNQTIAEIENLLNEKSEKGTLMIPFTGKVHQQLCNAIRDKIDISLIIQPSDLVRIIDKVRTIILNWALKLEEDGVMGDGLSFTIKEKQEAEKHSYNINNFYGSVLGSQIQQGSNHSSQAIEIKGCPPDELIKLMTGIKSILSELAFDDEIRKELSADIDSVEAQVKSPNPKTSIIHEGLKSIRTVLEGASGELVAPLLVQLGKILIGGS